MCAVCKLPQRFQAKWNTTPCCTLIIGCAIHKYLTNAQGNTARLREQWILQKERGFRIQQIVAIRDEQSHLSQTPTSLLLLVLRLLLWLRKILELQLRLLLTLRKLPSNSYRKDSVYFASWSKIYVVAILPLIEHKWLKCSRDKHNTERHYVLRFRVMA